MSAPSDEVERATRHGPRDAEGIQAAIHELRDRGYADSTIGAATGLSAEQVRRILDAPG